VGFGAAFMSLGALAFVFAPRWIVRAFTPDPSVTSMAIALLLIAAFFQLFDGIQVVVTGVMRGAGETRIPMLANLIGYWLLGIPAGYALCFWLGWGARGVWIGLCAGLIIIGGTLLFLWTYRMKLTPV
jgi:multidrug resistance protein, MATE family